MRMLALSTILLLCACASTPEPAPGDVALELEVEPEEVAAGDSITLELDNESSESVSYNLCSSGLEHNQAGAWHPIPSNRMCTMELRTLAPGEETRYPLEMPGGLEAGEYRFLTNLDMMGAAEGGSVRSGTFRVE